MTLVQQISQELLQEGKAVRLPVSGSSMYPTIRSGDFVWIEGLKSNRPQIGEVLYFQDPSGRAVIHRLIEIKEKGEEILLTAKGDGFTERIDVIPLSKVLGKVAFVERRGLKKPLSLKTPNLFQKNLAFIYYWLLHFKTSLKKGCL